MNSQYNHILVGGVRKQYANKRMPTILTFTASLQVIMESELSLARIGDGEFGQLKGIGCPSFEGHNENLGMRIREILETPSKTCLVGLNRAHYYATENTLSYINGFADGVWAKRTIEEGHLDYLKRDIYLDACITIPRHHYAMDDGFWDSYFATIKDYLSHKNVLLVTGDSEIWNGEYRLFNEACHDLRIVQCPSKGAFNKVDEIEADLKRLNSDGRWMVVFACGPAATVMAWNLSPYMQCLDLGHLAREYACWRKRIDPVRDCAHFFGS